MIMPVLMLSLALVIFNLTLPLLAGVYIVSDLGGANFLAPYTVAFYCMGNVISLPLGKPGMTRLDPIRLYILCLLLMSIFSLGCATAGNYLVFNIFRFFEGLASGPLYMLLTARLMPGLAPEDPEAAPRLPWILTCFAVTPVIGVAWGGVVAYLWDWRNLFYMNIPICWAFAWFVGVRHLGSLKNDPVKSFDWLGFYLLALAVLGLGTSLTMGQELDWFRSPLFTGLFLSGFAALVLFSTWTWYHPNPLYELQLLKNRYFLFGMVNVFFLFSSYFGMVVLLTLWLKLFVNYTPNWVGLLIFTMALGAWLPKFLGHKGFDPRIPLTVALLFLAISCFYSTLFNVEINFGRIAFSRVLAGLGLALFLPPLFRLSVFTSPGSKSIECANLFHGVRVAASGIGVSLYAILLQRRQVFYHDRLGSGLTEFSTQTQQFFERAKQFYLTPEQSLAQLNLFLDRQATALGLEDCFYLMGWIIVALLVMVVASYLISQEHPLQR